MIHNKPEGRKKDMMIIKQLYNGNHLNAEELERAPHLLHLLDRELKGRV